MKSRLNLVRALLPALLLLVWGSTATTLAFVATVAAGTTTYTDAARPGGSIYYAVIAVH